MKIRKMIVVLAALCVAATSGCSTPHVSSLPSPTAEQTSAHVTPVGKTTSSPTYRSGWHELTPSSARGDGRVYLLCMQRGVGIYIVYNVKTPTIISRAVDYTPDCNDDGTLRALPVPADADTNNPFSHWVSGSVDDRRQVYQFCSSMGTAFFWIVDFSPENPLNNGSITVDILVGGSACGA